MSLFVSMHFRFKLDVNANFTMQYGKRVFDSETFLLSPPLTPKDLSLLICYYITLCYSEELVLGRSFNQKN